MCARRLKYPFIMDYMRPSELSVDEFHSFCKPQHLFNPHACGLCLRLVVQTRTGCGTGGPGLCSRWKASLHSEIDNEGLVH